MSPDIALKIPASTRIRGPWQMTAAGFPAWNSERANSTAAGTTRSWQDGHVLFPGGLRPGHVWGGAGRELRITCGRRAGGDDYSSTKHGGFPR